MKTVKLLAIALFMGSLSFAQTAAPAAVAAPATPQTPSQMKWEKETHEFGTIEQGKPVSYEFTFTNTTNKDVTLKDVKASCGCTATNYTKTPIKPGEKATITATYNAASPGAFSKTVTVSLNENEVPKVLTIKGKVIDSTPVSQ